MNIGQKGTYLYKQAGEEFTVDAEVISLNGAKIGIEFINPNGGYRHRRILRTPAERDRFHTDTTYIVKRGPKKGNKNALLGEHKGIVLSIGVETVDTLYQCLALDGEIVAGDDPARIREYAQGIITGHIRHKLERSGEEGAIII